EQLPLLKQRVDNLQEKLQKFRQQYNLMDPQAQSEILSGRYSSVIQQQQENETQLGETQALYVTLQRQLGLDLNEAVVTSALSQAPRYQGLLDKLKEIETQIAVESVRFTSTSPNIQTLLEQRQNLLYLVRQEASVVLGRPDVAENPQALAASPNPIRLQVTQNLLETTNKLQVLNVRQQALALAENQVRQQLQQMAVIVRQYTDLERELQVATESLNRFLAVRENLQIEAVQKEQPWQLISDVQAPQQPVSPNVPRGLLLGGVAGILAGVGAALLADKLDNKFHSPEEIKESTGLPLLGSIPFNKEVIWNRNSEQQEPLPALFGRYRVSPYVEAFRSLHTNLYFLSPDKPLKTLVLSSSMPMEGKSTTSVHLARTAAALGQRVLLVDADLRCPQVHRLVDLPNVWGLSHVISTEMDVNDVIQRSPNSENLYILTAGQVPPDPVRLLSSKKMQSLVQLLRKSFDLVIFDTPPMLNMADAKLLSQHTDGMLMVIGLGQSDKHAVHQALDGLKMSQTTLLGAIANGVKRYSSTPYNYYAYQRYYTPQA
ncbi:MAG: polysaccharide biosynthesis tyrosine autokinase, partial [Cyanobacteriota bacterium]